MTRLRLLFTLLALLSAAPALAAKKPLAGGERLDLNRASVAELMRLPGVGRKKAEAIARRGRGRVLLPRPRSGESVAERGGFRGRRSAVLPPLPRRGRGPG